MTTARTAQPRHAAAPGGSRRQAWRRWLLPAAALLLAAACLLQPGFVTERPRFEHVVVFDITQSMNVADVQLDGRPLSRLALAKAALHDALLELPCGSKLGLAVFTEYRTLLLLAPVEVCGALAELRTTLAGIDNRMAWIGASEIAKGLHSARSVVQQLPGTPSLLFITDGHEAPPLNARHRPRFDDKGGEVTGVIIGVGGRLPSPIPKSDAEGRTLGTWGADEVLQTDPRSRGRGASVGGEQMSDDAAPADAAPLGATPGAEHLSALKEGYLRLLAGEQGLQFARLAEPRALAHALTDARLSRPMAARLDLRPLLAALALALLVARWLPWPFWWRRRQAPPRSAAR